VKFLLVKWVFWGSTVSNFRYFRMSAASDVYCMLMAEFWLLRQRKPSVLDLATDWQRD
jgi:hypothetical protein